MDPRVVAVSEEEVVILWQQRGVSPAGDRFDGPVLGLYQVREGKLARAQMFYFDTAALVSFLANAKGQATVPNRLASAP
jgi:ketosteroid isomerase-like protein